MIYEANDHPRHAIGTLLAQSNPERPLARSPVIYHCANDLQVFLSDTGKYLLFHYMPGNVDINLSKKDRMDEKTILPVLDKSSQALFRRPGCGQNRAGNPVLSDSSGQLPGRAGTHCSIPRSDQPDILRPKVTVNIRQINLAQNTVRHGGKRPSNHPAVDHLPPA